MIARAVIDLVSEPIASVAKALDMHDLVAVDDVDCRAGRAGQATGHVRLDRGIICRRAGGRAPARRLPKARNEPIAAQPARRDNSKYIRREHQALLLMGSLQSGNRWVPN